MPAIQVPDSSRPGRVNGAGRPEGPETVRELISQGFETISLHELWHPVPDVRRFRIYRSAISWGVTGDCILMRPENCLRSMVMIKAWRLPKRSR